MKLTLPNSYQLCLFIAVCSFAVEASENCDSLADQTSVAQTLLNSNGHLTIPAGEVWRIEELSLSNNQSVSGPGTICKPSTVRYALTVQGHNVSIHNVHFTPQTVSGQPNCDIKLDDGGSNVQINENNFDGSIYSAICAADDSAVGGEEYLLHTSGILISGNTFEGYVRPLFLHSVDNLNINNNIIRQSSRDAIRLRENDGYVIVNSNQFIDIGNHTVTTETQDAIDTMWAGSRLVITNNIVRRTEKTGFDIKGVAPQGTDEGSRSVIVANNHISETLYSAIVLHGDLDTGAANYSILIEGNILEGNTRSASYADAAIWAKGSVKYLTIANNQIRSNYARGITVQTRNGTMDGSVAGVHITGNMVINNGVASAASSIGIYVTGVQGLIATDNTIGNDPYLANPTTKYGLYISNVQDAIVNSNILRCNSAQQLSVSGTNTLVGSNIETNYGC